MNILLIGNGFDLAHGLPTTYKDFLLFMDALEAILEGNSIDILNEDFPKLNKSLKQLIQTKCGNERDNLFSQKKEWEDLIKNNFWRKYFSQSKTLKKENWIDFESEIAYVIKRLNHLRTIITAETFNVGSATYVDNEMYDIEFFLQEVYGDDDWYESLENIDRVLSILDSHLKKLIRALELYLDMFVSNIPVNDLIPEIQGLSIQYVLSFNYTDTYSRLYGGNDSKIVYDFIHGRAQIDNTVNTNNMVLGIDEYLDEETKDIDVSCIAFKKYFQRIYKMADTKYLDWIDVIHEDYEEGIRKAQLSNGKFGADRHMARPADMCIKNNLFIFGHSLDVTDGDVLKKLICNDNVNTTIFYHRKSEDDKHTLGRLITNLVKIIGSDELIRRTGGAYKTISFSPQRVKE